jgi:hypothetical protein
MIFVQPINGQLWTTLSHTLIIFLLSLSSSHFFLLFKKKEIVQKLSTFGCSNNITLYLSAAFKMQIQFFWRLASQTPTTLTPNRIGV